MLDPNEQLERNKDSKVCLDILLRFFPNTEDSTLEQLEKAETIIEAEPSDEIDEALDATVKAVEQSAVSPETIWKSIQALQRQKKVQWSSILELTEQIHQAAPSFEYINEVDSARARALVGMKRDIEAWIVYAQAIDRTSKQTPSSDPAVTTLSSFIARAELAELFVQGQYLSLAVAHANFLHKEFPEQRADLTVLYDFLGEKAIEAEEYEVAIGTYQKILEIDFPCET